MSQTPACSQGAVTHFSSLRIGMPLYASIYKEEKKKGHML